MGIPFVYLKFLWKVFEINIVPLCKFSISIFQEKPNKSKGVNIQHITSMPLSRA